jgi:hypothetical protein
VLNLHRLRSSLLWYQRIGSGSRYLANSRPDHGGISLRLMRHLCEHLDASSEQIASAVNDSLKACLMDSYATCERHLTFTLALTERNMYASATKRPGTYGHLRERSRLLQRFRRVGSGSSRSTSSLNLADTPILLAHESKPNRSLPAGTDIARIRKT